MILNVSNGLRAFVGEDPMRKNLQCVPEMELSGVGLQQLALYLFPNPIEDSAVSTFLEDILHVAS